MTDFAVDFRYPGHSATLREAKTALKHCRSLRDEVRRSLDSENSQPCFATQEGSLQQKQRAVAAFKLLNYHVIAAGDSFNDTAVLTEAHVGLLFRAPDNVKAKVAHFKAVSRMRS